MGVEGNRCVHAQLSNKEAWAGELHYFPFKIEFASRRDTYALLNSAEIKWRLKEFTGAMLEELVSISFFFFFLFSVRVQPTEKTLANIFQAILKQHRCNILHRFESKKLFGFFSLFFSYSLTYFRRGMRINPGWKLFHNKNFLFRGMIYYLGKKKKETDGIKSS